MTIPAIPIQELMPHRPPMLLLDTLLEASAEKCIAQLRVDPTAWYADPDGAMPGWFGLELMAQTITAYSGAQKRLLGIAPRLGFNLGTRSYECQLPRFPAGELLEIEIRPEYVDETGLSAFACEIRHLGQTVAQARLKTFEPL